LLLPFLVLSLLLLLLLLQAKYSNLVDTTDGFDGWVASNLPVHK
jgi:hypothetical protein